MSTLDNCVAVPNEISPISGQPGRFEVSGLRDSLPDSFFVNLESDTVAALDYLLFDSNRMAQTRFANAPENLTYGSSFDPGAAAATDEMNILLRRLAGTTPLLVRKMRINVTSGQLFEGTVTLYTGSIGGNVDSQVLDTNAAVIPSNNQGAVLDFFFPDNFVIDGFIGIGISLPITGTVQTYSITFEVAGIAMRYEMESPNQSICDIAQK